MNMLSPQELKLDIIKFLENNKERFNKGVDNNYIIECPYCGDSPSSSHGHFYIKINTKDTSAMLCNCFRCPGPGYGIVDKAVLERIGYKNASGMTGIDYLNRNAPLRDADRYVIEGSIQTFDYYAPSPDIYGSKVKYLNTRLDRIFTEDDLNRLKVITSFREFVQKNGIQKLTCSNDLAMMFETNYLGFLGYGNSSILFRDITGRMKYPWVKYPIHRDGDKNMVFYSLLSSVDPFTSDEITINLSEGVLDAIGVAYSLGQLNPNTINIAVTGKYYEKVIFYLLKLGFVGSNITLHIFSDNDKDFNKKAVVSDTALETYRRIFKSRKHLFGKILVSFNIKYKDYGVSENMIALKTFTL